MLNFRNLNIDSSYPVTNWGFEGILTVLERGGIKEWHKLYKAIAMYPYGKVADELEEAIKATKGGYLGEGIAGLFFSLLEDVRNV
jgi:hypothetical protein